MAIHSRAEKLANLKEKEFDLLVIGGGITGAGVARDAAMRGLSVALVEHLDFASGASSKSSKLLHGGIRYLEQFHLALVFEASQERRLHSQSLSPHLAKPVPFLIPVYPWSPHGRLAISMGVFLYDMLALFRNHGTHYFSRQDTIREEPGLEQNGLKGSVVYHDVVMDDARLTVENIRSAEFHGATILNYLSVKGFEKLEGKVRGVWVQENKPNAAPEFLIKAKAIINSTGAWSDKIRQMANAESEPQLRPTKGVHLVLPKGRLGKEHAFVLTAKADNRVFFSIPWYDRILVGTTDTDYKPEVDGSLEQICANQNEVDYLMESIHRTFPNARVKPEELNSTFAGLRPLVSEGDASNASAVSREHRIWQDPNGLINIAGGKYTTYRTMAAQVLNVAIKELLKNYTGFGALKKCETHLEPIVASAEHSASSLQSQFQSEYLKVFGEETIAHLQARYGARWQAVADLAKQDPALSQKIVTSEQDIMAEAVYARDAEMAVHFEDFLRRRTQLALKAPLVKNIEGVKKAAEIFSPGASSSIDEMYLKTVQGLNY